MEYNTQQRRLPLPEYGRSVQNMVDHALTIEDRAERQRCANTIINIFFSDYYSVAFCAARCFAAVCAEHTCAVRTVANLRETN